MKGWVETCFTMRQASAAQCASSFSSWASVARKAVITNWMAQSKQKIRAAGTAASGPKKATDSGRPI
jgi:hypothetical protein